jgi:hypothetical protein
VTKVHGFLHILHKSDKFVKDEKSNKSFEMLRVSLTLTHLLHPLDFDNDSILYVFAS